MPFIPVELLNQQLSDLISGAYFHREENQQKALSLIEQGADIATQTSQTSKIAGNTLLLQAIADGEIDFARKIIMLDTDKTSIDISDKMQEQGNNTPLILAIKKGAYTLALELVNLGVDVDKSCGRRGITALQLACLFVGYADTANDNETLIRLINKLILTSANPFAKNEYGVTALDLLHTYFKEDDIGHYVLVDESKNIPEQMRNPLRIPAKEIAPSQITGRHITYKEKSYLFFVGDAVHCDDLNLATTLFCNCTWHRQDFWHSFGELRTDFLKSEVGANMVAAIEAAFDKLSPQKAVHDLNADVARNLKPGSNLVIQVATLETALDSLNANDKEAILFSVISLLNELHTDFSFTNTLGEEEIQRRIKLHFDKFKSDCDAVLGNYNSSRNSQILLAGIIGSTTFLAVGLFTSLALTIGLMLCPPVALFIGVLAGVAFGVVAGVLTVQTIPDSFSFFRSPVEQESKAVNEFLKNTVEQDKLSDDNSNYSVLNDFLTY